MTPRRLHLAIALVLTLGSVPVLAEREDPAGHAKHTVRTVILDNTDVRPSTVNMEHNDVIEFANYSAHPIRVTFTEPKDLKTKIRCGLVAEKEGDKRPAEWALFSWKGDQLVGTIPPGRFASVCALEPGTYSFTAMRQDAGVQAPAGASALPAKAQIVVK